MASINQARACVANESKKNEKSGGDPNGHASMPAPKQEQKSAPKKKVAQPALSEAEVDALRVFPMVGGTAPVYGTPLAEVLSHASSDCFLQAAVQAGYLPSIGEIALAVEADFCVLGRRLLMPRRTIRTLCGSFSHTRSTIRPSLRAWPKRWRLWSSSRRRWAGARTSSWTSHDGRRDDDWMVASWMSPVWRD